MRADERVGVDELSLNGVTDESKNCSLRPPRSSGGNDGRCRLDITKSLCCEHADGCGRASYSNKPGIPRRTRLRDDYPNDMRVRMRGAQAVEGAGVVGIDGARFSSPELSREQQLPSARFARVGEKDSRQKRLPTPDGDPSLDCPRG